MAATPGEKKAYAKGYSTGRACKWPNGVPPIPNYLVMQLAIAAKKARDTLDGELAMMDPGDEWESKFGPAIDAVDLALEEITTYALIEMNTKE